MYGKRPLWQWVVVYLIIGGLVYAAIYYFVLAKRGGYDSSYKPTQEEYAAPSPKATVETATLFAVGNYKGSGTATRSFDGATFTHAVRANLSSPAKGKFYEGWLVDKEPTLRFFSTGKMTKNGEEYILTFTAPQNYPDYNDVVITQESESMGLDGKPEAHVLEGSF